MTTIKGLILACPLLFYLSFTETSSNDDYTCVAGNFTVGRPGSVTCHFGPNVYKSGYHFEVVRYPFQAAASQSGEDVLRCHRLDIELRCMTGKGYKFDENVEDNLTISIPNVTHDQAGRYACQLIPPDNRKKRLCVLNVRDVKPIPETISHDGQFSDTVLVLAVLAGALLVLCIIFVLLFISRKHRPRKWLTAVFVSSSKKPKNAPLRFSDEEEAERTTFIMTPIVPYSEPEDSNSDEDNRKKGFNGDEEDAKTIIMPPIVPYSEPEDSNSDEDNRKKGFDADEEDARRVYKVNISLEYKVDYDTAGESTEKRRYSGDEFDKGREAVKITIKPYDEDDTEQPDQVAFDPPWGIFRRPRRLALPRLASATSTGH